MNSIDLEKYLDSKPSSLISLEQSWDEPSDVIRSTENIIDEDDKLQQQQAPPLPLGMYSNSKPAQIPQDPYANFFSLSFQNPSMNNNNSKNQFRPQPIETGHTSKFANFFHNLAVERGESPQARSNLSSTFQNNFAAPILKLRLISAQKFELEREDIASLFSRYGTVVNVILRPDSQAYIIFSDIMSALYAQKALNGHYIQENDVRLSVSWCNQIDEEENGLDPRVLNDLIEAPLRDIGNSPTSAFAYNSASPTYHTLKYTCKYEIQIDNDRDFQVARRIIGSKGCNMKRVIDLCQKRVNNPFLASQTDFLKLRLRGIGSGFKEGPEKKESDEALHLCISSKHYEVYRMACQYVEELLHTIYQEYKFFCQRTGRRNYENLQIKCIESVPNKENMASASKENTPTYGFMSLHFCGQPKEPLTPTQSNPMTDTREIERLIESRNQARREMNFVEADRIRDVLKNLGVALMDEKGGKGKASEVTNWKFTKIPN